MRNIKIILDVLACIILLGGYFLHKAGKISHKFSIYSRVVGVILLIISAILSYKYIV
ncbi:MAG: hypothetical protein SOR72_00015 [Hornefia sp.]|nr:hypothetical protein [Hornefia sp.]